MQSNRLLTQIILLTGFLAVLVLGFLFDYGMNALTPNAGLDMKTTQMLTWLMPLFELLLALATLFLFWLFFTNGGYSQWVCYLAIVAGLLLIYTPALLFRFELPDQLYILQDYLAPGTFLFQAGAMVAAVGFATLGLYKPEKSAGPEQTGAEPAGGAGQPPA